MELWGRCGGCARWFFLAVDLTDRAPWMCPVCGLEPIEVENRAAVLPDSS
jgi:hypothetical protein